MSRRSIEMYEYRQALMRMRQGDSEREIARSKLVGAAAPPNPSWGTGTRQDCTGSVARCGLLTPHGERERA